MYCSRMYKRTVVTPYNFIFCQRRVYPFSVMQVEWASQGLDLAGAHFSIFQSTLCWPLFLGQALLRFWLRVWTPQPWSLEKIQLLFPSRVFSLTLYPSNSYNFKIYKYFKGMSSHVFEAVLFTWKVLIPKHYEIVAPFSCLLEVFDLVPPSSFIIVELQKFPSGKMDCVYRAPQSFILSLWCCATVKSWLISLSHSIGPLSGPRLINLWPGLKNVPREKHYWLSTAHLRTLFPSLELWFI